MANPKDFEERQSRFERNVENRDKANEAKDRVAEQQRIAAAMETYKFDKSKTKTVTLEDGTKAYCDGNQILIADKEGVFITERNSGKVSVTELRFDENNKVSGGSVVREPKRLKDKLDKFSDTDIELGNLTRDFSDALNQARFEAMTKVDALEKAENSPEVKQIKELALKEFGFDKDTLKVEALDNGEVAVVAKNGVAIGKGNTFYFTPKKEDFDNMSLEALKEVTLNAVNGKDPMFMSMTVGADAQLVKKTYDKMQEAYMNVGDYDIGFASMLNQLQSKAENRMAFNQSSGKDR